MGETRRISCPRAWLANCHTASQKRAAQGRSLGVSDDLWDKVKFIRRKGSAYSGRILLI